MACALLASSLLAGASGASTPTDAPRTDISRTSDATGAVAAREFPLPRHDLIDGKARARWKYKYAAGGQYYRKGERPTGLSATFTVHRPKQVRWRHGDHSLAEIAIARPGGSRKRPSYIEAGWVRGNRSRKVRLFVYWWGLKGGPKCYNLQCRGFVRSGKGKRPGAVLKPGTKIRLRWVHRHNRWNLFVNGKRSGYYPDRLWKNRFNRIGLAQLFGEVAYSRGGRCIDMGTGRFPRKHRGAKISKIRVRGKSRPNFRQWNEKPRQYRFKRINRRSFRYGGPGPC
ncbi:MAG: neprosin family prolyl endopeptidase [Actinomycetia bacterium]|nr:neprosin family prolyl endopeptidase [Actinomycetes bacterium]